MQHLTSKKSLQPGATGTDARQVAAESGIAEYFPKIDFETCDIGVFGKKIPPGYDLLEGRIEIYRPLIADPKEVRKQRAAQGLRMKKVAAVLLTRTEFAFDTGEYVAVESM